jgi:hypothetical protein
LLIHTSTYRSIGKQFLNKEKNSNPGPGTYDPKIVHHNPQSIRFTVSSRPELFNSNSMKQIPGPGAYKEILRWAIKSKMTIGRKYKNNFLN